MRSTDDHDVRPDRVQRRVTATLLALTVATGIVDAIGFLGLDRVFAGNMTGNVVILGMGLAGADDLPVVGPAVALGGFLLGAAWGGRALRRTPQGEWRPTTTLVLVVGSLLLGGATVALFLGPASGSPVLGLLVALALATAMGTQAVAARRLAVQDITTVVVTSTLTGLAADSRLAGAGTPLWRRRLGSVGAITLGATAGALLLMLHAGWGLLLATVLTQS